MSDPNTNLSKGGLFGNTNLGMNLGSSFTQQNQSQTNPAPSIFGTMNTSKFFSTQANSSSSSTSGLPFTLNTGVNLFGTNSITSTTSQSNQSGENKETSLSQDTNTLFQMKNANNQPSNSGLNFNSASSSSFNFSSFAKTPSNSSLTSNSSTSTSSLFSPVSLTTQESRSNFVSNLTAASTSSSITNPTNNFTTPSFGNSSNSSSIRAIGAMTSSTSELPKLVISSPSSNAPGSSSSSASLITPPLTSVKDSDVIKTQRALIETIHHERLEDLVTNWEKRIQDKINTFLQFSDLLAEIDRSTILEGQKLVDLRRNQQISFSKQKQLSQILQNIEQQQEKLSPVLNAIENDLKLTISDYQDKNGESSSVLLNSQQLQRLEQQINEISELFTKVAQETQPDVLFSINQSIAIQEASIETLSQQTENLESRLETIINRIKN